MLREIAYKTGGVCAECFRADTNALFERCEAIGKGGERFILKLHRSRRSPSERRNRRAAKNRAKQRPEAKERNRRAMLAQSRAKQRLRNLFPEIYEILLADERAKLELNAWTIERTLTPHEPSSSLDLLATYHRINAASVDDHDSAPR